MTFGKFHPGSGQCFGPCCNLSRRGALGLMISGASVALSDMIIPGAAVAQSTMAQSKAESPRRIDVHHHIVPKPYIKREREKILATVDTDHSKLIDWTPERAVEEMDRNGVATAMTSLSIPGAWFGDKELSRTIARECNDYAAQMVRDFPGRFGVFAALPLPDPEGSLREAVYAYDTLKVDGIGLLTSYDGRYLGEAEFEPVYAELNRRNAIVFVHPASPGCCSNLMPGIPPSVTEFLFDTTRAISSLMFNGVFTRYPNIRFIFSHAGGPTPVLAARMNSFVARHPDMKERVPDGVIPLLKKQFYDIANSTNPSSLGALLALVPLSQVLFGSDTPYVPIAVTARGFDNAKLTPEQKAAINRENALQLFPRLKT